VQGIAAAAAQIGVNAFSLAGEIADRVLGILGDAVALPAQSLEQGGEVAPQVGYLMLKRIVIETRTRHGAISRESTSCACTNGLPVGAVPMGKWPLGGPATRAARRMLIDCKVRRGREERIMDMAPWRGELEVAVGARPAQSDGASKRALDTLQGATQVAMMMALAWPAVAMMPFFWAPPFWVMAGIARGRAK
jgi:hypothetical protein